MIRNSLLAALAVATAVAADPVALEFVPTGASREIGYYMPQRLELTAEKPAAITKLPDGLTNPQFGLIQMGPKEGKVGYAVVIDQPAEGDGRLFVDSNHNGDLTDDGAATWASRPYQGQGGVQLKQASGGADVVLPYEGDPTAHLMMYRFDPKDTQRAALANVLLYYRDYGYKGQLALGDKTYNVMLSDDMCRGEFSDAETERGSGVRFLIDVNGNGKFDQRGEMYDAYKPFNIAGTSYQLADIAGSGASLAVGPSAEAVDEILPPPDLSVGQPAVPFSVTTTDGDKVEFPKTFAGKVVMLDFWATWCGPCRGELPGLTAAYNQFHERGFEVLGISLDQAEMAEKLAQFCEQNSMPWDQVYDGKYWQAEIAQLYVVQSIPAAFLVDGDTGRILAAGNQLRGESLAGTIEAALKEKGL